MRYNKDQFLLPLRVDLIREERRRLVDIPDRTTAEYDLEKLNRRSQVHEPKITKRGKTYTLAYTMRTPYSEDFWTPNPSNPAGHPWAATNVIAPASRLNLAKPPSIRFVISPLKSDFGQVAWTSLAGFLESRFVTRFRICNPE